MKRVIIEPTANTPVVVYDADNGCLSIEGRSIPENPAEFYEALLDWAQITLVEPFPNLQIEFRLEFINSASAKQILAFLKMVRSKVYEGCPCAITWYYEGDDESIQELGEHLQSTLGIAMELKEC